MKNHAHILARCGLFLPLLMLGQVSFGGGLQMVDPSARTMGIGGTLGALTGDPTAMHANPATLSFMEGPVFSFGATVKVPDQRFYGVASPATETKMQAQVLFPPDVCLTYTTPGGFGAGVSVTVPYEIQTEWDPNWVGDRLAVKSDLRVAMVSPALSMKFSENFSVGLALELGLPRILYEQRFPVTFPGDSTNQPDADVTHDGSGNVSYGLLAGVFYRPDDFLSLGASYRSHMNMNIEDGRVRYRGVPDQIAAQFPEGRFSTNLVLPNQFLVAASLHPASWLNLAADIEYSLWSEFSSVKITYSDPARPDVLMNLNWKNVLNARFGLEAAFSEFSIRAGIRFENSPVPDASLSPGLPDASGKGYSLGFGYRAGEGLVLDFAYALMRFDDRRVVNSSLPFNSRGDLFNGLYTSQAASIAINVTYSWN
ncbi:MAG TPA: outer membrane protein transport protein [Bacteroidota bacterium]|nr:outer membrane protein transport protein [Bacteroidota bacterium]